MNLTWHIVKKDLRRMAAPVGVWLLLIAASAVWFRLAAPRVIGHVGVDVSTWIEVLRIWTLLLTAAQWTFAVILIGALLLEDPIAPTNAFWATRPIANCRLLAAKVMATLIAFVALPVVVLVPVWLSIGCGWSTLTMANAKFTASAGAIVLFALTLASLSTSLRTFLGAVVGIGLITGAGLFPGFAVLYTNGTYPPAVITSSVIVTVFALVLYRQLLAKKTTRSWATLLVGLVAAFVVAMATATYWTRPDHLRRAPAPLPDSVAATIHVDSAFSRSARFLNAVPNLYVTTTNNSDREFYAPGVGRSADGVVSLVPASNWGQTVAIQLLQDTHDAGATRWQLLLSRSRQDWERPEGLRVEGTLDIWQARAVVVGELRLRVGDSISGKYGRTKIAALDEDNGRLAGIWVEEREVSPETDRDAPGRTFKANNAWSLCVDRYVLTAGTTGRPLSLYAEQRRGVSLNEQAVGYRRLGVSSNLRDWSNAVLTKVRITSDRCFAMPLKVSGTEITDSLTKP